MLNSTELKGTQNIKLYHFVHTILSVPFCPIPFCPYHFVRYYFVRSPLLLLPLLYYYFHYYYYYSCCLCFATATITLPLPFSLPLLLLLLLLMLSLLHSYYNFYCCCGSYFNYCYLHFCLSKGLPPELYTIWEAYPWLFGQPYCLFKTFLTEMTSSASILTILAFTVERYMAICHPMKAQTMSNLNRSVKVIVAIC